MTGLKKIVSCGILGVDTRCHTLTLPAMAPKKGLKVSMSIVTGVSDVNRGSLSITAMRAKVPWYKVGDGLHDANP
jgi:hypothetical protein